MHILIAALLITFALVLLALAYKPACREKFLPRGGIGYMAVMSVDGCDETPVSAPKTAETPLQTDPYRPNSMLEWV